MSRLICESIPGPTIEEAKKQLAKAKGDLVELRLDLFSERDIQTLQKLKKSVPLPMIFTLRSRKQGGSYMQPEKARLQELLRIVECHPEYLDVERDVPPEFVELLAKRYPDIKIIISMHDFTSTPDDLDALFLSMQRKGAYLYKIAVTATSSIDALRLLCWAKGKPVIAISMGPFGQLCRILEKHITYACLDEESKTAPGQLTIKELENYSGKHLYGLIGDPVTKSISHITHNHMMRVFNLDSLYVKMQVQKEELERFFFWAKRAGFRGLSVTMPLKEAALLHLDEIDPEAAKIGAVNTLVFKEGRIHGYNTDGKGALNAIERTVSVDGKRLVLLGAGGAARAIAYEAKKRGASVTILNRDAQKARDTAASMQIQGFGLDRLDALCKEGYDTIINATPLAMPCTPKQILAGSCVMDINTLPKESLFLQHAKEKGCSIVYGLQMFVEQAALQFSLWFPQKFS